ncbi:MAG TPA: PAS domain-containing protein [Pedobacter sp.]|nr:PAS domain-containing protein [Pedobacter sp.]
MKKKNTANQPVGDEGQQRRKSYEELAAEVAELRAVLQSISDGVYIGGMEGITLANQPALDQLGFTTREELNRHIGTLASEINTRDAVTGEFIPAAEQAFAKALQGERVTQDVLVTHRLTGEEMFLRCAASPVIHNEKIVAAVAVNTDITQQYKTDTLIRETQDQQNFLLKLSDAARQLSDPVDIQQIATEYLAEYLKSDRCFYAQMDELRQRSLVERDYVRRQSVSLIGEHRYQDFGVAVEVMRAGKPFIADDVERLPELRPQMKNYEAMEFKSLMATPLIKEGQLVACMAVTSCMPRHWTKHELTLLEETAERTWAAVERARAEKALQQSEAQFRSFVAASSDMVYRMSSDWQKMHVLSGEALPGDSIKLNDRWLDLFIPKEEQPRIQAAIAASVEQKKILELEHRNIESDGRIAWRLSRAIPVCDQNGDIKEWLGTARDITARKMAEQRLQVFAAHLEQQVHQRTVELKDSRDQLQSIFDTTLMQMSILRAERDPEGQITDLVIQFVNREVEKETGRRDLVGKRYAQEYPGIRETDLFDLIVQTIETGEPQQAEYHYPHEGFNRWYSCSFVKLNDGVVAVNMDISARKLAEEERFKNYMLLRQSEEVASLGSWDFDLLTGVFSWSDGMYRLFDLDRRAEVSPEIYLNYTTQAGRPAAERVVNHIRRGDSNFTETLEIKVHGELKVLRFKATVIKNSAGNPIKVLGVDMDITAGRLAAERIKTMEQQQQQEIVRVTLSSQEEERRRISENLHNGLAQMLYGIKINMSTLTAKQAVDEPDVYQKSKNYVDQLLSDAIQESRNISHELMPSVLADFGLEAAINDVSRQLSTAVQFQCTFRGLKTRSDKYIELAVFRIVQELMLNVVKHSGSTNGKVSIQILRGKVHIEVEDNGKGMPAMNGNVSGIGLASIGSKVKLLNGSVSIDSVPGYGTKVVVSLPLNGHSGK